MSRSSVYHLVWLASLLTMFLLTGKPSDAQGLTFVAAAVVNEKCEVCPSYCDENGAKHDPVNCRLATSVSFCCNFGVRLDCCSNESLKITSDIGDGFHCSAVAAYNRTVLSVCVPLGFVCFVAVVVLFIFQKVRSRKRRRRSNTSHTIDRRSSTNASCSSRSSRSSIGSLHFPHRDSVSHSNSRQQQQQQEATVVISPSNLEDSLYIGDDVLRVFQTVNAVPAGTNAAETCFIIQSTVYPPPYTDEMPPPYSDIFPS